MKTEKKLIACSIVALFIGVSAVFPLAFLMSATAQPSTGPEPWFNIDIPYAYWETLNGPILHPEMMNFTASLNETNSVSERHTMPLNITVVTETTTQQLVDAQLEYFQIEINTDKEYLQTAYFVVGTNGNSNFDPHNLLEEFQFNRTSWFNTDNFDTMHSGGGGLVKDDWTSEMWSVFPLGGSGTGSIGGSSTYREVEVLRAAETITISVYRVGLVTFSGDSTIVTLTNNELIDQIQLEKYGKEGFLYNDLIPDEDLATVNLLRPVPYESLP
jgi:hypothetical protein